MRGGRSLAVIRAALMAAGGLIAAYLTVVHYSGGQGLVCSSSGLINCETVLTSPQAVWAGLPVAVWGVLWFALGGAILILQSRREKTGWMYTGWLLVAVVVVVVLVYNELVVIRHICAWCSGVHLTVLLLLLVEAIAQSRAADPGNA